MMGECLFSFLSDVPVKDDVQVLTALTRAF